MAEFFIRRPIVAMVISIVTVIVGVLSMLSLPTAQFPDIVPPEIVVSTTYTGADAQTIEQSVATPLEQQMSGVDRMIYMKSTNANDGTMSLRVTFEVGTNIDMDNVLVQNRVSQANASLPPDVKTYGVTVKKSTSSPLMIFALYSPSGQFDAEWLGNYATINLRDAMLRVQGVGDVVVFGSADYAMRVWLKPDKLKSLGLAVNDVVGAVQKQSTVNPAGKLGAEPAPAGTEFTYTIRAQGRYSTAEEFGEIVVRSNADGSQVRLKDVARIELGSMLYQQLGRMNGKPAGLLAIYQIPGTNALEIAKGANAVMAQAKAGFPSGVEFVTALDTTLAVSEGMKEIVKTLEEALILVLLVVFLFLQSVRATIIPMLTVPVSLIGTFAVFPMLGFSINTLSLFGLILAIGLVVDDAIVVVEAVMHHIEHGMSPRDATSKAMKEVSGPVVAIAVILAAVFIPAGMTGGITGMLNQQFAVTIAISMAISAFNALTLSPALCALLLKPKREKARRGPIAAFFRGFNKVFDVATNGYVAVCHGLIRKFVIAILILAGFFVVAGGLGKAIPGGFLPDEDQGFMFVAAQLPDAASLQRTDAACKRIEEILQQDERVQYVSTIGGYSLLSSVYSTNQAFFFVSLKPWEERHGKSNDAAAVAAAVNQGLKAMPEARAFAFLPPPIMGIGTGGGFSVMVQDRAGATVEELQKATLAFMDGARKRPEIGGVNTVFVAAVPQMFANVDKDKVLKQGLDVKEVYTTLQALFGGLYVNDFNRFGRQWKVFVQAEGEARQKPEDVDLFAVRNKNGVTVPLGAVMGFERTTGPEFTNRFNLFRAAEVTGVPAAGYSSAQAMAALEEVAATSLPQGFGFGWNAMSYQESKAAGGGSKSFVLSLVLVFLVLAGLYESWMLPWSVLLTVPIAVAGAFTGLFLRHMSLDVYGQIGLVMLIGLAAKNAILIVEFAKAEVEKGRPLVESALDGAKLRLRPILMTSFAFILGCVPLWAASGSGAVGRTILGTVVIVGMAAATFLGIFLIPPIFWMVERIRGTKPEGHKVEAAPGAAPEGGPAAH